MSSDIVGYIEDLGVMGSDIVGDYMGDVYTGDHELDALLAMGAGRRRHGPQVHRAAPGKHMEVRETSRGVWREQYVPLNLPAGTLATVAAGATVIISTILQKKFRPNRLIIDSGLAGGYIVNDIRVGVAPQLAALGSLPGRMFTEFAVGIGLHGDTGDPGITLAISVTNITGGVLQFFGGFQGIAVE